MFLPPRQEATIGFALLDGVNERVCFLFLTAAFFRFYEALASKIKKFLEEQKMFKKIASLTLALVMLLGVCVSLSSCGDAGVAALICLHGDSSTYDKNFIDAFKTACANKGLTEDDYTIIVDIPEGTACYDKAAEFADKGYDVVFADSFGHESYMSQAAKEFPDVQFCHATGTKAHTEDHSN